jgi:hypothetical protein
MNIYQGIRYAYNLGQVGPNSFAARSKVHLFLTILALEEPRVMSDGNVLEGGVVSAPQSPFF